MLVGRTRSRLHDGLAVAHKCATQARHAVASLVLLFTIFSLLATARAQKLSNVVYRTTASISCLPSDVAVKGDLAELNGIVTLSSPRGIVLQDHTGGIWVEYREKSRSHFAVGDVVTVVGAVGPGAYSPEIVKASVWLTGHAPLPPPRKVSFVELSSGQEDAHYVAVEGIVRTVTLRDDALTTVPNDGTLLTVDMPEGRVDVALPTNDYKAATALIGAKVKITATAMARKNDDMQQTGFLLVAPDISDITALQMGPTDLFSARIEPIGSLLQYGSKTDYFHRIRIRGTLTYYDQSHRFILQDGSRAIEVLPADSPQLQIGDDIEAVGFPMPDAAGPILSDAVARRLGHELPPAAIPITLQEARASSYRSRLVSMQLRLVRIINEPERTLFLLEAGHELTTAELDANIAIPTWLRPGSDLKLTGIDMLTVEGGIDYLNYRESTVHSVLLLRSLNDISLISSGTWWTRTYLVYLVVVLVVLVASFLVLLTYVQLKRWKVESMLHERERLARDVHDTLAQSFAGVGFQLQVIRRAITTGDSNLLHHLDTAKELVQFSHREARRSLAPTSSSELVGADLLSSLKDNAQALVKNGLIQIEAHSTGSMRALSRDAKTQLFRIGQEAIANAVRHADPTHLVITVAYEDRLVRLKVIDNGCGFVTRGDILGFGIRGMRKRASEIDADFDLESTPGIGTTIVVSVPILKPRNLFAYFITRDSLRQ